jgi:hypothetical protein
LSDAVFLSLRLNMMPVMLAQCFQMAVNGGYVDPLVGAPYQPQQSYPQHQAYQQQQNVSPVAPAKVAEPPKPKGPIPEEHMYLQTVFEELRNRCAYTATNPVSPV